MDIKTILEELALNYTSYSEVIGGADSAVWKINNVDGTASALRVLPAERVKQFQGEEKVINYAIKAGIPVPSVYSVKVIGKHAVMLMEWANGKTALQELIDHPESAYKIGVSFGNIHGAIHDVTVPETNNDSQNWITPKTEEEQEIINKITANTTYRNNALLHLDYHPLNVLTNGEKITAVIDWANATTGDPRMDMGRTYAILQLEGKQLAAGNESMLRAIEEFERGWLQGYSEVSDLKLEPIFNVWAGVRMERDLYGKREEKGFIRIREWVDEWKQK